MSVARNTFCDRIGKIRRAVGEFQLGDLPAIAGNLGRNDSARIIRSGLVVQCFNIFEDFVKARIAEVLHEISSSGVAFKHLPENLQWATTVEAVRAIESQLKLQDSADRIRYAQDYSEKLASTKLAQMKLAEISFFHTNSNISREQFRDALSSFAIDKPWQQTSGLASRVGISGMPAEEVFSSFAERRHRAAHKASYSISESDLMQSFLDASGLALGFDVLISKSTKSLCCLKTAHSIKKPIISDHATIPLRFIKFLNGRYNEVRENGRRAIRSNLTILTLVPAATLRSVKENGVLVIYDTKGMLESWLT